LWDPAAAELGKTSECKSSSVIAFLGNVMTFGDASVRVRATACAR
jgi:hypothetical protein